MTKELRKASEKFESLSSNKKDPVGKESTDAPKSIHTEHELDLILVMIAAAAIGFYIFR